jgi:broad specificity phosphatase PhoE
MKLYFVRHGESEANLLHEFSNRGFKHGLTERGFQQAKQLGLNLDRIPFKKIYSSPLKRAVQTAEILQQFLNCPLEITDALREFDTGILEGKSDPESWDIHTWVLNQWIIGNWEAHTPGGESRLDIQARFMPLMDRLTQNLTEENYLLVGHGGIFQCMFPLIFTNLDDDSIRCFHFHHTMPIIAGAATDGLFCSQWGELKLE